MKETKIIPFGKYRGQQLEIVAQDVSYSRWLTAQNWFPEKFQDLHLTLINLIQPTDDTPEHNKIQVMFLRGEWVRKFLEFLGNKLEQAIILGEAEIEKEKISTHFECDGWDVVVDGFWVTEISDDHGDDFCWLNRSGALVEIKPSVGDDFPSILRQMKSYGLKTGRWNRSPYTRVLLYGEWTGSGCGESEFRDVMEKSGIRAVRLNEI